MSLRYKISNEAWIWSVFLAASECTSLSSQRVTAPVPLQQCPCSCRALAEQPPQIHPHLPHRGLKCSPSKTKGMLFGEESWSENQASFCAHALPSLQCLSGGLVSLDIRNQVIHTPFAGLSNSLGKSLVTALRVFFPSSEIFLTKFRLWLYRCLF